jgi:hypothetical protein
MENFRSNNSIYKILLLLALAYLLYGAIAELYMIASGTGNWLGGFSLKWGVVYFLFVFVCISIWLATGAGLFLRAKWHIPKQLFQGREKLGIGRWILAAALAVFPVWLLQYSSWGIVFNGIYLRLTICAATALLMGFLITGSNENVLRFPEVLLAALITGSFVASAAPFMNVTSYPFSLGWSEGNRLWDYSLRFGKDLYTYDTVPSAYLDIGRQLNGGLPFLLPGLTIAQERMWVAFTAVLPYILLGVIAFRLPGVENRNLPFFAGLWAFIFVNQGPIHAPLLWSAILVALAWRKPLWLAIPLVTMSAYAAQASRFTWLFAPAMWAVMLELGSAFLENDRIGRRDWVRTIAAGLAGVFGGYIIPKLPTLFRAGIQGSASTGVTPAFVTTAVQQQPLLWYRLFPNATYGSGILLGLLVAAGPLLIVLVYLAVSRRWRLNFWQKSAIVLIPLAFLVVGLIASTKIGGGGDLHNMDMFILGLMFAAAIAWRGGGAEWLGSIHRSALGMRLVLLLLISLPVLKPLMSLRPLSFAGDVKWLSVLVGTANDKTLTSLPVDRVIKILGSLPLDEDVDTALSRIQDEVSQADGEILFMDQRQLLTFGFIQNVKLVPEYEKKRLMDEALSGNVAYFGPFYKDLAAHRFALIISEPLLTPIKDSSFQFGEENNAWVTWVSHPVLCFYEEKELLDSVGVQLLVPKNGPVDCSDQLP